MIAICIAEREKIAICITVYGLSKNHPCLRVSLRTQSLRACMGAGFIKERCSVVCGDAMSEEKIQHVEGCPA